MIRILARLTLAASALFASSQPTQAAEGYDSCTGFIDALPATISRPGTWCLRKHLSTAITSGNAITVSANDVTIDCNGFKIGGLAAGQNTEAQGIAANFTLNTTVRNCTIRGFDDGIDFFSGHSVGNYLIEDNHIDGNAGWGIIIDGPGSTVRDNIVTNTGRSTRTGSDPAWAIGIYVKDTDVIDNTVNGVVASGGDDAAIWAMGIALENGSAIGNRIRGLATSGGSSPWIAGIQARGDAAVFENIVQGPDATGDVGILCDDSSTSARANIILGFETGIDSDCFSGANHFNPN